jgi:phospholipase C
VTAPGVTAQVTAAYNPGLRLVLSLTNGGTDTVTFTVAPNNYSAGRPRIFRMPPHGRGTHVADPLESSHGWYDLSVTISGDGSWSRRYTGHLENGSDSITG